MSTTELLRWCEREAEGSIHRAIDILHFAKNHNARSATRVLQSVLKRSPSASHFKVRPSGFVEIVIPPYVPQVRIAVIIEMTHSFNLVEADVA